MDPHLLHIGNNFSMKLNKVHFIFNRTRYYMHTYSTISCRLRAKVNQVILTNGNALHKCIQLMEINEEIVISRNQSE